MGVAASGNCIGLSEEEFTALSVAERAARLTVARQKLQAAGAHYVVDTLAELSGVIDDVDHRLNRTITA